MYYGHTPGLICLQMANDKQRSTKGFDRQREHLAPSDCLPKKVKETFRKKSESH